MCHGKCTCACMHVCAHTDRHERINKCNFKKGKLWLTEHSIFMNIEVSRRETDRVRES